MLNSLTSFRFVAAFMVFIFHLEFLSQYQLGSAGVQFFFILSGFILAYNYHSKFKELSKNSIRKFYLARFAKIYPVHVLTFVISAPLVIFYFHPNGMYFIKLAIVSGINLLLIQSFIPNQGTYFNFNGVSWTLSVETLFYLSLPFVLWVFNKLSVRTNIIKSILVLIVVWIVLFIINGNLNEDNHFQVWLLHIFPIIRLFDFSTGILLALIFIEKSNRTTINKTLFTFMEFLSLLLLLGALLISVGLDVGTVGGVYFVPTWCILIYTFAHQGGILSKALSKKLPVYLGEISFSFYMIHLLIISYFSYLNLDKTVNFFICFVLSLLLSAMIFKYYEEPLRKRIRFGTNYKEVMTYRKTGVEQT